MQINFFRLADLSATERARILKRTEADIQTAMEVAARLVNEVREQGDAAISRHLAEIDRVELPPARFKVAPEEYDRAEAGLAPEIKEAVRHAIGNVRKFHESQMPEEMTWHQVQPGVMAGEKITAIDRVGLYVPRGKGAFPSVMIMLGVPAKIAGVREIAVCTPPNPDGSVDAATLFAARLIGIESIYRIGGASAIAALAFGTEIVPKVDKILGPGNQYCSAAKRLLVSQVDVGLPAGPSESIILADDSVSPEIVALDLSIEAEHGPDSAALLVTHSEALAQAVREKLPSLINSLPAPRNDFSARSFSSYGGIVLTRSLEESIEFVNDYAPEHMELLVREPFAVLGALRNAGEILIGPHTPICVGNYCLGVNAILPTGGFAKAHSCTSIHSFLKRTSLAYCSAEGFERLRQTTALLADYEGFPAHARAATQRPKPGAS